MYTGNRDYTTLDTGLGHVCAHSEGTLMAVLRARVSVRAGLCTLCRQSAERQAARQPAQLRAAKCTLLHLGPTALLPPLSSLPPHPQQLPCALLKSRRIQEWEQVGPHARC